MPTLDSNNSLSKLWVIPSFLHNLSFIMTNFWMSNCCVCRNTWSRCILNRCIRCVIRYIVILCIFINRSSVRCRIICCFFCLCFRSYLILLIIVLFFIRLFIIFTSCCVSIMIFILIVSLCNFGTVISSNIRCQYIAYCSTN